MKHINERGFTNTMGGIFKNVSEKNNYYLDLLENGKWMVSYKDKKIGIFSNSEDAIIFFLGKTEPRPPLTEKEEIEALNYLKNLIN